MRSPQLFVLLLLLALVPLPSLGRSTFDEYPEHLRHPRAADTKDTKARDEPESERFKEDFKQFLEDTLKKKMQEVQEGIDDWKAILDDKAGNITEAVSEFKEKMAGELEEKRERWNETRQELKEKLQEWREQLKKEKQERENVSPEPRMLWKKDTNSKQKMEDAKAEWDKLHQEWKDEWAAAVKEQMDKRILDAVEDYLEKQLEKELKEREASSKAPMHMHHPSVAMANDSGDGATTVATTNVAVRAAAAGRATTLLDDLTGASAWRTMAWVLLVLCIVLAVGLIVLVIFQVMSRKKQYEPLDGRNSSDWPPRHEGNPMFTPATTSAVPRYTEKHTDLAQQF